MRESKQLYLAKENPFINMNKLKKISSIPLIASSLIFYPSFSHSVHANTCSAAINWVKEDISERRGGSVSSITTYEDSNSPFKQKGVYLITLRERIAVNYSILKSPDLLKKYASRLINNCNDIIGVSFGVERGGGVLNRYSYRQDRTIQKDICYDALSDEGRRARPVWGTVPCT